MHDYALDDTVLMTPQDTAARAALVKNQTVIPELAYERNSKQNPVNLACWDIIVNRHRPVVRIRIAEQLQHALAGDLVSICPELKAIAQGCVVVKLDDRVDVQVVGTKSSSNVVNAEKRNLT
jgi:hypothetical protein